MEKLYSPKTCLKMAGGGGCFPHTSPESAPAKDDKGPQIDVLNTANNDKGLQIDLLNTANNDIELGTIL